MTRARNWLVGAAATAAVIASSMVIPAQGSAITIGAGSISGVVRAAGSGDPVPDTGVTLIRTETVNTFEGPLAGPVEVASTTTAADGTYHFRGLAPTGNNPYWVCFEGSGLFGPFLGECYAGQGPWFDFPDPFGFIQVTSNTRIGVAVGQAVINIDAALVDPFEVNSTNAGSVAGRVTDLFQNRPLNAVRVTAWDAANHVVGNATTGSDGTYQINNLLASVIGYKVCFDGIAATGAATLKNFGSRCYPAAQWQPTGPPPASAVRVPVSADETTTGINVRLSPTVR